MKNGSRRYVNLSECTTLSRLLTLKLAWEVKAQLKRASVCVHK